jgi:hypothetical protein
VFVFLLIPTFACTQVMNLLDKPTKVVSISSDPLWPNKNDGVGLKPPVINQLPPYGTSVMIQKIATCNNTDIVKEYTKKHGLTSITFGTTKNEMGAIISLIQVYANLDSKQFVVVEHFATQKSCIFTKGNNFEIIIPNLGTIQ